MKKTDTISDTPLGHKEASEIVNDTNNVASNRCSIKKAKVYVCTSTEALYRPYGP